eukprot:3241289-Rhodomonas_salina.3
METGALLYPALRNQSRERALSVLSVPGTWLISRNSTGNVFDFALYARADPSGTNLLGIVLPGSRYGGRRRARILVCPYSCARRVIAVPVRAERRYGGT